MLTPRGAALLGASLALGAAGILRIDGVLMTLGTAGILFLATAWIIGRQNLTRLDLTLQAPGRVFADTPFDLRIFLQNQRALFDAFGIHLQLHLSKTATIRSHTPWAAARSSATVKLRGSISSRGDTSQHPCTLSSSFPLGLMTQRRKTVISKEILVFPKAITPKEFFATGEFDDAWHGEGLQAGDAPGEPRGIRPYRPGDPAKRLHWPSTIRSQARGRAPRIRESDPPGLRPRRANVVYHSFGTDGTLIRTDHFERSLSLLCGTLRHLRQIGVPATLSADFLAWKNLPTFHSEAWSEALTTLARATRADDTEAHDLEAAVTLAPSSDALIIVSDMPPESWTHVLPNTPALIIDISQHGYRRKPLNFKKNLPLAK